MPTIKSLMSRERQFKRLLSLPSSLWKWPGGPTGRMRNLYPAGSMVILAVSFSQRGCEAYSLVPPTFLRAWLSPDRVAGVSELKRWYEKWSACIQGESNGRLPETASYASPDDERDTMITFLPSEPQRR